MFSATSKPGNSEVYVVCLDYCRNLTTELQTVLYGVYNSNSPDKAIIPLEMIPEDFIDRLLECQTFFIDKQKEEIMDNIRLFQFMSQRDKKHLYFVRNQALEQYFTKFNVEPLLKGMLSHDIKFGQITLTEQVKNYWGTPSVHV